MKKNNDQDTREGRIARSVSAAVNKALGKLDRGLKRAWDGPFVVSVKENIVSVAFRPKYEAPTGATGMLLDEQERAVEEAQLAAVRFYGWVKRAFRPEDVWLDRDRMGVGLVSDDFFGSTVTKVVRRARAARLLDEIPREFPCLWYENQDGDRFVPTREDMSQGLPEAPEGFDYFVSRFPTQLSIEYLSIVKKETVDACPHPEEFMKVDHGIIDSMEGRTCEKCGGHQSKEKGQPWPAEWEAYGSSPLMTMNMGWSDDLAVALVKQGFKLSEAIVVAACACERCMNVLADECGLDWGYPEGSEDYEKCGTSCGLCEGKPV